MYMPYVGHGIDQGILDALHFQEQAAFVAQVIILNSYS